MRKTLLATFFLFILFSCNSSQKNTEVDNFPDVELSFMDIKIGEKSDSVIIKLNDSQKYPSIIDQEWEDNFEHIVFNFFYYPSYLTISSYCVPLADYDINEPLFDEGKELAVFNTYVQTHNNALPAEVKVLAKNNHVNRIVVTLPYSNDAFNDLYTLYAEKYGVENFLFESDAEFVLQEYDSSVRIPKDNDGYIWKFKNNKRICLIERPCITLDPREQWHSQGIWIVYEDATDYYEYLENNKTFLDAKIKEKNTEVETKINNQDI